MAKKQPTAFEMVGEFHEVFGHPKLDAPTEQMPDVCKLRINLLLEEMAELIEAVGGDDTRNQCLNDAARRVRQAMNVVKMAPDYEFHNQDRVEIADALSDILYVANGAGHAWGLNLDACVSEVHRSNMTKLGDDGLPIYNPETNKVMKGPNFEEPNLARVLGLEVTEEEPA